ncbi:MAG: peptidylprolyl isomerase [Kiritimatiellia bacterium]
MSAPFDRDHPIARVNGEEVPFWMHAHEMGLLLRRWVNAGGDPPGEADLPALKKDALENAVEHVLLLQHARALTARPAERDVRRRLDRLAREAGGAAAFARQIGRRPDDPWFATYAANQVRLEKLFAHLTARVPAPDRKDLEARYASQPFLTPEVADVSVLCVEPAPGLAKDQVYAALLNARSRVLAGGRFEAEAARLNTNAALRANGGDLGTLENDGTPLARVVFALEAGQVGDIVEMDGALYVFRVRSRQPARPMTFEECAPAIREALWDDRKNAEIGRVVDEWRRAATIEILEEP